MAKPPEPEPWYRRYLDLAACVLAAGALAALALVPARVPPPLPSSAPPAQFSAVRAFTHVERLARTPHSLATAANADAREYIVGQLAALGLQPQVQVATVKRATSDYWENYKVTMGVVHNIVVRIPGAGADHGTRPALLLAAHYDTRLRSQGAAEAGASVAAMLETLRALRSGPPLANDVICLIADGQENGALGARAFAGEHPWARDAGLVLGFDNAGTRGPLQLYDASADSGAAIRGWASATPVPSGSSLMPAIYQRMPGARDFSPLKGLGVPALLFANIEGGTGARGARDQPSLLDRGTLQQTGDTMLALTRHFGARDLSAIAAREQVVFTLPFIGVVHYSYGLVWPITRIACLLFFGVACLAVKHDQVEPIDIIHGALGFAAMGALMAFGAWQLWLCDESLHPLRVTAEGAADNDHWYLAGIAALGIAAFALLQRRLRKLVGLPAAVLGALMVMLLLLLYASWQMPGATYVLAWPAIAALLAFGALYTRRARGLARGGRVLILLAGAAPAVVLGTPVIREVFAAMSPEHLNLPVFMLLMLLGPCTALIACLPQRALVAAFALAGVALLAAGRNSAPYAAPPPQPNRLAYYKDAHTWKSYWILPGGTLDSWTRNYFPEARYPLMLFEVFGYGSPEVWAATGPRTDIAYPAIELLKDDDDGHGTRHVEFFIQSQNAAPQIAISLAGTLVQRASIDGQLLTVATKSVAKTWALDLFGMGTKRMRVRLDVDSDHTFRIFVEERTPGLPKNDLPARPAGMKPELIPLTETTISADTLLFR